MFSFPQISSYLTQIPSVPAVKAELQAAFKETKLLIIDEKGMIGLGRLAQIDSRLKELRPEFADQAFGGLSMLLAGDFRQLPPVCDLALYSQKGGDAHQCIGRMLYKAFDKESYQLRAQMRQQGDNNAVFRDQLERLAQGKFTQEDWTSWSHQNYDVMDKPNQDLFNNMGIQISALKRDCTEFNLSHLRKIGNPIAQLSAINSRGASVYEADHANGLRNKLYLAKGAKVVLTSNIWPQVHPFLLACLTLILFQAKLVNGSKGTVEYMIYKEQGQSLPDLVICHFPDYTGPSYLPGQEKMVPLAPLQASWTAKGQQYSRTQYPLILGWAITIHKGQGSTQSRVKITHLFNFYL